MIFIFFICFQNMADDFHDDGTLWSSSKPIVRKDKDHAFIDYTYKRKKVLCE